MGVIDYFSWIYLANDAATCQAKVGACLLTLGASFQAFRVFAEFIIGCEAWGYLMLGSEVVAI